MNRFHRLCSAAMVSLLAGWISLPGFAQDTYPKPVSEYAEETGPGTMVYLSYPKWTKNAEGKWVLVNTTLVPSTDPAGDYEVTQGIWQLKVKKDGTFQAEHEGDVFTYRFNSLGTGRGSGFKPFELGEADFSRFIVTGDTIRWSDVYPDIDLSVRYIHDILKVDVIVKNAFMADLKAEAKAGKLNKNDYLTARFDIPQVLITSKAKQNGMDKDLYAEALDVEQPIYFEKDGKVVHKLRPVEAYLLDGKGEPVYNTDKPIRTAQVWNLKSNTPGVAEMSVLVADLADLPEGDVVIDPSIIFDSKDATYDNYDTVLKYQSYTCYGSSSSVTWGESSGQEDRALVTLNASDLGTGKTINSAKLFVFCTGASSGSGNGFLRAYKVTTGWHEPTANWFIYGYSSEWTDPDKGGDFDETCFGQELQFASSSVTNVFLPVDVTIPFKSHYEHFLSDIMTKGFLLKGRGNNNQTLTIAMKECTTVDYRPFLLVRYNSPTFGNDIAGWGSPSYSTRMSALLDDNMNHTRFFSDGDKVNYMAAASPPNPQLKVLIPLSPNPLGPLIDYEYLINNNLTPISAYLGSTVFAIQLGNELDDRTPGTGAGFYYRDGINEEEPLKSELAGRKYADFYVVGWNKVKTYANQSLQVFSGSLWNHSSLDANDQSGVWSQKAFLKGFLDGVIAQSGNSKLPDCITIHGYTGDVLPEWCDYAVDSNEIYKEWIHRLSTLETICIRPNYIPKFAVTEWGYAPDRTHNPTYSCIGANEGTQAIYYMRRLLMDATMRSNNGITWDFSYYWAHNYGDDSSDPGDNTGWFKDANYNSNSNRAIRKVGNKLLTFTTNSPSLGSYHTIWIPAQSKVYDSNSKIMTCGWINRNNEKWIAVWRFKKTNPWDYSFQGYDTIGSYDLEIEDSANGTANIYKFTLGSDQNAYTDANYSNTSWPASPITRLGTALGNNKYRYSLPSVIDENPTFIRITN